jgi:hypothetical protein
MQLTITNLTTSPVYIGDLYASVAVGTPAVIQRSAGEIQAMQGLMAAVAAGTVSMAVVENSAENTSNVLQAVEAAIPMAPPNFTTAGRPAFASMPSGSMIFNTTTNIPNFASAGGWRDATGAVV